MCNIFILFFHLLLCLLYFSKLKQINAVDDESQLQKQPPNHKCEGHPPAPPKLQSKSNHHNSLTNIIIIYVRRCCIVQPRAVVPTTLQPTNHGPGSPAVRSCGNTKPHSLLPQSHVFFILLCMYASFFLFLFFFCLICVARLLTRFVLWRLIICAMGCISFYFLFFYFYFYLS